MEAPAKYRWLLGFTGFLGLTGITGAPAFLLFFGMFGYFGDLWWRKLQDPDERLFANKRLAASNVFPWCLCAFLLLSVASSMLFTDPWTLYRMQLALLGLTWAVAIIAWAYLTYRYDR